MSRLFLTMWLLFGVVLCRGQVVWEPLYDDLSVGIEWQDGRAIVDSVDMRRLLELAARLDAERDACGGVVVQYDKCDSLIADVKRLRVEEKGLWEQRVQLEVRRGDEYKEMLERAGRGRTGATIRSGVIGGVIGAMVGLVVGAVVW